MLAWRRTSLALLVNGALVIRAAVQSASPALGGIAVLVLMAAAAVFIASVRRGRALQRAEVVHVAPPAHLAALVTAAAVLACAAAAWSFVA